jgi:predicted Rossmann fold flavoprotein
MNQNLFDVAVVGGGPAGMMAAGQAALAGARVILVEKNNVLGLKLRLTGKSRCNITNAAFTSKDIPEIFGKNGSFFYSALNQFDVAAVLEFFNSRGLATKVERGNRVFPVSDDADQVALVLEKFMQEHKVTVLKNMSVTDMVKENNKIIKIVAGGKEVLADNFIICTGGLSYPLTGSTGDGFNWAKKLGHTVIAPQPGLTPLLLKERWIKRLEGLSLKNAQITIKQNKPVANWFGEALFTSVGMSGPIIIDMSKTVINLMKKGEVKLSIDLKPALEDEVLDKRILRDFAEAPNKVFKNSLDQLLPEKMIAVIVELSKIDPEKQVNSITKTERADLVKLLKGLEVTVSGFSGFEKAIITTGGVSLKEIDSKTMRSKIIDNLYFAGEVLDLDGPTGGYNLQVCWSTGVVAGRNSVISNE